MRKIIITICTIVITGTQLLAQKRKDNIFFCGYSNNQNSEDLCSYLQRNAMISDKGAENAVDKILSPLGLPRNFVLVSCPKIRNAVAVTPSDGIRYIVYDPEFMEGIDQSTTNWSSASILAHEIGHHLCGHTLVGAADLADSRKKELEADEFSGFVLFKMGATLSQAQAAIVSLGNEGDDTYSTHPTRSRRLDSIEKGFDKAQAQAQLPSVNVENIPNAEYFFDKGFKALEEESYQVAIDNFTAAINVDPNGVWAYNNRGVAKAKLGNHDGAMNDFTKAMQIDPNNYFSYLNIAIGYTLKAHDNSHDEGIRHQYYSKALKLFNKSIELDQSDYLAFFFRAEIKRSYFRDYKGAISDYSQTLQLNSNFHEAYRRRGYAKKALNDYNGSLADFNKAIEIEFRQNKFD